MPTPSRKTLLTAAVVVLIGLLVFGSIRYGVIQTELEGLRAENAEQADRLMIRERLAEADSLVYAGEYDAALERYAAVDRDTRSSADSLEIARRVGHVEYLVGLQGLLDTLRSRRPRFIQAPVVELPEPAPAPVERLDVAEAAPNRYDSLSFALLKAETQIRNLQRRLNRRSGPNYLTFRSREGNEVYYVGEISGGKANGRGVALLSTGSRYIGEWQDNQKHGEGEFHWADGAYYEGEYENDRRSGQGTYHFPKGDLFIGEWEDDLRNGEGVFYDKKGKVVAKGVWEDDELVEER